jgi:hypothetical protein
MPSDEVTVATAGTFDRRAQPPTPQEPEDRGIFVWRCQAAHGFTYVKSIGGYVIVDDLCPTCSYLAGRRDERERCADIVENDPDNVTDWRDCCRRVARDLVLAIRREPEE